MAIKEPKHPLGDTEHHVRERKPSQYTGHSEAHQDRGYQRFECNEPSPKVPLLGSRRRRSSAG